MTKQTRRKRKTLHPSALLAGGLHSADHIRSILEPADRCWRCDASYRLEVQGGELLCSQCRAAGEDDDGE